MATLHNATQTTRQRMRVLLRGVVQGVGFRPFVYRLATELGLDGWVNNSPQGVCIELEGEHEKLDHFIARLPSEKPSLATITACEVAWIAPTGASGFTVQPSNEAGVKTALVLPDLAPCPDCLRELFDPNDRRYHYPFTNCTNCGPRYTIIEQLPYDRRHTTMRQFAMCPHCLAEYEDPRDRRFHAQPNACPLCGPQITLWDADGTRFPGANHTDAVIRAAAEALRCGEILAIKGMGGFQLMVDARNDAAVQRLRERKMREEKPFALMYPTLEHALHDSHISADEARLLGSSAAPIVLLRANAIACQIAPSVAPNNPYLGVMLPATPLHHLLMAELGFPVVATSGNRSDEPICIDEHAALLQLHAIADLFLVHNRPIIRHVDDSVTQVVLGHEQIVRRARGYAPLPIHLHETAAAPILALGAHQKNSVALAVGQHVFVSQHIGDLDTVEAFGAFERTTASLCELYEVQPALIVHDLHPDYRTTQAAQQIAATTALPLLAVQHHYAHALACLAEHDLHGPALAVTWDGTGDGGDGTIWGGEFLRITTSGFQRVAHLRTFGLPGGECVAREPRRSAWGLLYELFQEINLGDRDLAPFQNITPIEQQILGTMLQRGINTPRTSSAGRLFDAVAALLGLRQTTSFEGQAAMELEFVSSSLADAQAYPFTLQTEQTPWIIDWGPAICALLHDLSCGIKPQTIAANVHAMLVEAIVAVAFQAGEAQVVLSGGCFQNRKLLEHTVTRLQNAGFQVCWSRQIPPNDGGIALGQVVAALRATAQEGA